MIGDVPIYVAPGSADQRAHPELFRDDAVAGTPPDAFTSKGQLWGNPLYDWPALQRRGYAWWVARLARTFALFDLARIDHFRGFVAYWAVPRTARHALSGRWRRGPGRAVFDAAQAALGELPLIAEDLGVITPAVDRLRTGLGLPGMAVLQFGFDEHMATSVHAVANIAEDRVAYTGTHDNDTLRGWYESIDAGTRARVDAARPGGRRGAVVGPDRAALRRAGAGRDGPGAGRARPGQRGADEPAGDGGGRLEVAAGRAADGGRRAPRCGRRRRPPGAEGAQSTDCWITATTSASPVTSTSQRALADRVQPVQ